MYTLSKTNIIFLFVLLILPHALFGAESHDNGRKIKGMFVNNLSESVYLAIKNDTCEVKPGEHILLDDIVDSFQATVLGKYPDVYTVCKYTPPSSLRKYFYSWMELDKDGDEQLEILAQIQNIPNNNLKKEGGDYEPFTNSYTADFIELLSKKLCLMKQHNNEQ